jgi:rhomboid protease GluP
VAGVNEQEPAIARVFEVRYGPPQPKDWNEPWANNLQLTGRGRVEVTDAAVRFSDARNSATEAVRTMALADIANVEFGAAENLVVVRSRNDQREVCVWLATTAEAQSLIGLLPKTTTEEFSEHRERHRRFRENLATLAPRAPVTPTLIVINVALFVIMLAAGAGLVVTDGRVQLIFGSNYGPLTWHGQPWRLLTSAFIHFGIVHLAFNMFALYQGGGLTEKLYGSARFAVIYLLSALAGSVASGWWDATRSSAGASGAVFGAYGALLAFLARRPGDIPVDVLKSVRGGAISLCVYSLAMGAVMPFIDNAAHVGGLLGGAASGYFLARPFEPAARAEARPGIVAAVIAGVCAVLVLLGAQVK